MNNLKLLAKSAGMVASGMLAVAFMAAILIVFWTAFIEPLIHWIDSDTGRSIAAMVIVIFVIFTAAIYSIEVYWDGVYKRRAIEEQEKASKPRRKRKAAAE